MKKILVLLGATFALTGFSFGIASAQVVPACSGGNFDTFASGTVNGQGGWSATNPAIDQEIVPNTFGFPSLGCKALRISNASTSQIIVGQVFSNAANAQAGELQALDSNGNTGTAGRPNRFEAQFDLASVTQNEQPGLHLSVSPDRGDGTRMGAIGFVDTATGIDMFATDVTGTSSTVTFTDSPIATGLSRATPHTIKYVLDFNEGPSNDASQIFIDGNLVHTGTSWENFYRFDSSVFGGPTPNNSRTVSKLVFYEQAPAATSTQFNGYLIGNVSLLATSTPTTATSTGTTTPPTSTSTFPVITLNGSSTVSIFVGGTFTDPGATALSGTTTIPVVATGTVNTAIAGSNTILYTATDSSNNVATTTRTVNVISTSTPPIITLNGSSTLDILLNSVFTDPGAAAVDAIGTSIPVVATGTVNTAATGTYTITYSATDVNSNTATTSRTVNVATSTATSTPPATGTSTSVTVGPITITLNGSSTISFITGDGFVDPGATATEGSTTLPVTISTNLDPHVLGTYTITYTATDGSGNSASVTRTVNIVANPAGGGGGVFSNSTSGGGSFIFTPVTSGGTPSTTTTTTTNQSGSTLPPVSVGIITTPTGQVLGVATVNFSRDLKLGSSGDDVMELQKYLISQGDLILSTPTRYFGKLTQNALKKWQKKMGLPQTGYFGRLSRGQIQEEQH